MKTDRFFSFALLARAASLLLILGSANSLALSPQENNQPLPSLHNDGDLTFFPTAEGFLASINFLKERNSFGLAGVPYINVQLSQSDFDAIKEKSNTKKDPFDITYENNYDGTHMDIKGYVSMGCCIWYGEKTKLNYTEDWPAVAKALHDSGVNLPAWALGACPWANEEELVAALQPASPYYDDIQLLKNTLSTDPKALDVLFRFGAWKRFLTALDPYTDACDHYIFKDATPGDARLLATRFNAIAAVKDEEGHPLGLWALMDYDNFKGEGTSPTEIHNTQHWGLQPVLRNMDPQEIESLGALQAFVNSASRTLQARMENTEIEIDRNNTPVPNDKYDATADRNNFSNANNYRDTIFNPHVNSYLSW